MSNKTVKEIYKDIKKVESKNNFHKRHSEAEEYLNENLNGNGILFKTEKGVLHVFGESFHQLSKLAHPKKDGLVKYVIRNRYLITGILVSGILVFSVNTYKNKNTEDTDITPSPITTIDDTITINKIYTVQPGDTLSQLSIDTGISKSDIKFENRMDSNLLYMNEDIKLPYEINNSNIDKYTKKITVETTDLSEIANEYNTDIKTLKLLNEEAIEYDYETNKYVLNTNVILVPDFSKIEKSELDIEKQYVLC